MTTTYDGQESAKRVCDSKGPLKGKGVTLPQWLGETEAKLAELYADMATLSAETKSIEGRQFALFVYQLRDAKQLRWRMRSSRHTTWRQLAPRLLYLPEGLARWYAHAEDLAQVLNHREQVFRYQRKTILRLMVVGERSKVPRMLSVDRAAGEAQMVTDSHLSVAKRGCGIPTKRNHD